MKTVSILLLLLLFLSGCGGLATVTPETPFGAGFDPNQAQIIVDAVIAGGEFAQATGVASGNPAILGLGSVIVALGAIAAGVINQRRNKNEKK